MPPRDMSAWRNRFRHSVSDLKLLQGIHENSYYLPKKMFPEETHIFYIYVQPVLIILLIIWLALSVKLIWSKNFIKQYGLMTAYTSLDIVALTLQDLFVAVFILRKENYVPYEWCYAFEAIAIYIPGSLHAVSTWLKLAQSIRVFLVFYKPLHVNSILSKYKITVYILFTIVSACVISAVLFEIDVNFEKTILLDRTTGKVVEVCRDEDYFKPQLERSINSKGVFVLQIVHEIYKGVLPCFLMITLTGGTIFLLKKQQNIRKTLNQQQTNRQESDERLAKVTIAASVTYTIVVLPSLPVTFILYFYSGSYNFAGVLKFLTIMHTAFIICNVPITFILYNWLSRDFREKVIKLYIRLYKFAC
ncbi:unnamed protein product [Mytilus coruscus]|uniref:G-protein coupled receptors family 1 profile domain-containing protein n=1 Tax=Mytilus coruscus TaxID=42192 RepID=A0A6J8BTF9_MYTCO|nr:unnamed protein product [Mytilus coruscus]